jgi:hypothetical protein
MLNKYSRLLVVGVGLAVVLFQPSTAWAQAGPNLTIAMSHGGNFTLHEHGVYTIVVSNIGGTATTGTIFVTEALNPFSTANCTLLGVLSETGAGWSCFQGHHMPNPEVDLSCSTSSVIASHPEDPLSRSP